MSKKEQDDTQMVFGRVSLHDLRHDQEYHDMIDDAIEALEDVTGPKVDVKPIEAVDNQHIENLLDEIEKEQLAGKDLKDLISFAEEGFPSKTPCGLRRSQSDAAESSSSLVDKVDIAEEAVKAPSHEKHRFSLTSAIKTPTSPHLRQKQNALDSKIHSLLQEGKEFLHRKRHQVPLFAALANKNEPASSSGQSHASSSGSSLIDSHFGRTGSIAYRRHNDSVTLDTNEPHMEQKKISGLEQSAEIDSGKLDNQQQEPSESGPLDNNQQGSTERAPSEKVKPSRPPPPARPVSLPQTVSAPNPGNGAPAPSGEQQQTKKPPSQSSIFWKYHKEIIGAVLFGLTVAEFSAGFRPLPLFFLGLLWGLYVAYLVALVVFWFLLPPDRYPGMFTIEEKTSDESQAAVPGEEELKSEDTVVYKGWMNRLSHKYDPRTYHINGTHSVLVRLDRSVLRLSTPKVNLPRHVSCRDIRMDPTFISQEMFDITGATVVLRPKNLAHRRWWSRKYPITIILAPQSKNGNGRRDSTPSGNKTNSAPGAVDEKTATDATTSSDNPNEQANVGEVGTEAVKEEKKEKNGNQTTDTEGTDDEGDEDEGLFIHSLHSTSSLPLDLSNLSQKNGAKKKLDKNGQRRRVIHLFARSSREKEHWFYKLRESACYYTYLDERKRFYRQRGRFYSTSDADSSSSTSTAWAQTGTNGGTLKKDDRLATEWILYTSMQRQYERHMRAYMTQAGPKVEIQLMDLASMMWKMCTENTPTTTTANGNKLETPSTPLASLSIEWANAFGSRLFYDFSRNPQWIGKVRDRIQRKLATIRLPYFIETLSLNQLEPGTTAPRITAVKEPSINEWGLWIDTKLEYLGGFRLVLETKMNLMKLKTEAGPRRHSSTSGPIAVSNYENEDIPESPESSPDEEAPPSLVSQVSPFQHHSASKPAGQEVPRERTGKKILNFVDKIAQSKYFQEATENKYLKRFMQGVSDTPLVLEVEVMYVSGALAINLPPPPSDRLWYGFRSPPKVVLKARPRVGDRVVNLSHITDWIENKLVLVMEKTLVIPNMDDLVVPIMSGCSAVCNKYNA